MTELRLPPVAVDGDDAAREALRAAVHAVVFARALGPTRARTEHAPRLGLAYERCDLPALASQVDAHVESYLARRRAGARAVLRVRFHERRLSQGWLFQSQQLVPWEAWLLSAEPLPQNAAAGAAAESAVALLETIVRLAGERAAAVPPLGANPVDPFPMDIAVVSA